MIVCGYNFIILLLEHCLFNTLIRPISGGFTEKSTPIFFFLSFFTKNIFWPLKKLHWTKHIWLSSKFNGADYVYAIRRFGYYHRITTPMIIFDVIKRYFWDEIIANYNSHKTHNRVEIEIIFQFIQKETEKKSPNR